ncbi:NAD(P)-dependent alcohol dehydrogenase [Persicimonas caeni]|uniref:NAD(P)-dependent alcohol dehydrogenase n=1 Tax=Persicimonas caeni TaxID=2292766 RepID=A0A4Y6Q058_PERCE|nr:NAD(P)-dependent alcohol dehydrogenase [Persicimonas caeni]QDG53870.1 NAD(P)-dependent alcohol dehydrogenase [Persicimonas caeni]QED35091.1 NAD(P)-dependent alcohol dehydrogenase [Persicimonas caeni]
MKAATYDTYGAPDVLTIEEVDTPTVGAHEVLVQVLASPVTQGDRRVRAADYPGILKVPGCMMTGLFRPSQRVPGTNFAGKVVAVGAEITRFGVGDDVYGACDFGAYAEYLCVAEDSAVAPMPKNISYERASTLPYGAVTALTFLRDLADVRPGERVLIVGAAGGVGRMAVSLAKQFGAEVTGVCRGADFEMVRSLGADHLIDYTFEDFRQKDGRWDVIFDTSGTASFSSCRASLTPNGRFMSLYLQFTLLMHMLLTAVIGGPRALFAIALPSAEKLDEVRDIVEEHDVRPELDRCFPLEQIRDAHARVEDDRPRGDVVVSGAATHCC